MLFQLCLYYDTLWLFAFLCVHISYSIICTVFIRPIIWHRKWILCNSIWTKSFGMQRNDNIMSIIMRAYWWCIACVCILRALQSKNTYTEFVRKKFRRTFVKLFVSKQTKTRSYVVFPRKLCAPAKYCSKSQWIQVVAVKAVDIWHSSGCLGSMRVNVRVIISSGATRMMANRTNAPHSGVTTIQKDKKQNKLSKAIIISLMIIIKATKSV